MHAYWQSGVMRCIDHATASASDAPRITPSMKRKGWVSWAVLAIAAALLVAML